MPWISNHKNKIKEKSTKSLWSYSNAVSLGLISCILKQGSRILVVVSCGGLRVGLSSAGLCIRAYLAWSMNHLFNAVCITQQLSILSPPSVPNLHFWYNFCPSALWGGGVLFRFNSSRPLGRFLKFGDNRNGPIYPRVISFDKVKLYYHLQASSHIIWSLSSLIFSEIFLLSLYISFHISL